MVCSLRVVIVTAILSLDAVASGVFAKDDDGAGGGGGGGYGAVFFCRALHSSLL